MIRLFPILASVVPKFSVSFSPLWSEIYLMLDEEQFLSIALGQKVNVCWHELSIPNRALTEAVETPKQHVSPKHIG